MLLEMAFHFCILGIEFVRLIRMIAVSPKETFLDNSRLEKQILLLNSIDNRYVYKFDTITKAH